MNEFTRKAMELADEMVVCSDTEADSPYTCEGMAAAARAALLAHLEGGEQKCACGQRAASQCDEEWGPTCDLGNNEKHARRAPSGSAEAVDAILGINRATKESP